MDSSFTNVSVAAVRTKFASSSGGAFKNSLVLDNVYVDASSGAVVMNDDVIVLPGTSLEPACLARSHGLCGYKWFIFENDFRISQPHTFMTFCCVLQLNSPLVSAQPRTRRTWNLGRKVASGSLVQTK